MPETSTPELRLWDRLQELETRHANELALVRRDKDALLALMAARTNQTEVANQIGMSQQEVQRRIARWRREHGHNTDYHFEPLLEAMRVMDENEQLEYDGEGVSVTAEIHPVAGSPDLWGGAYTIWTDAGADGPYLLERDSHDTVVARVESIARDKGALS